MRESDPQHAVVEVQTLPSCNLLVCPDHTQILCSARTTAILGAGMSRCVIETVGTLSAIRLELVMPGTVTPSSDANLSNSFKIRTFSYSAVERTISTINDAPVQRFPCEDRDRLCIHLSDFVDVHDVA